MIQAPIVLWPREVVLTELSGILQVSFKTDFPFLRREVDLCSVFENAFIDSRVAAQTIDGTHLVRIQTDADISIMKRRANRIVSALCLIHDDGVGPSIAFSLGWNFIHGTRERTRVGELELRAKWHGDAEATRLLVERTVRLVLAHDALRSAGSIMCFTSSKQLASTLAEAVASGIGVPLMGCEKLDRTRQQHAATDALDFNAIVDGAVGNFRLPPEAIREPVLIIDDLYRTGGSILEVTKCLHDRGVSQVFSVTAVKAVKFYRQT